MISLVHSIAFDTIAGSSGSQSLGFSVSVGRKIDLGIRLSVADDTPPDVSDNLGNTYTPVIGVGSGSGHLWLYRCIVANAGTPVIAVDSVGAAVRWGALVFSGSFGSGTETDADSAVGVGSPISAPAITSATNSSVLVAACGTVGDVAFTGPSSPWAFIECGGRVALAYRILSAAGSNGVAFSWTSDDLGVGAVIASFDESTPAGPSAAASRAQSYPGYPFRY